MATVIDASFPTLVCPDCYGTLDSSSPTSHRCRDCGNEYENHHGMAQLVGSKSEINFSELQIQDEVSVLYENVRYMDDTSLQYHHDSLLSGME